jgi:hypothetical protein
MRGNRGIDSVTALIQHLDRGSDRMRIGRRRDCAAIPGPGRN